MFIVLVALVLASSNYFDIRFTFSSKTATPLRESTNPNVVAQCSKCHVKFSNFEDQFKFIHNPVAIGDCYSCHEAREDGKNEHGNLIVDDDKLCFTCHQKEAAMNILNVQHKPFIEGNCIDCHNPHGSNYNNLLKVSGNDLCSTCHQTEKNKVVHKPYGNNDCTGCHVPHASQDKGLTRLPNGVLCLVCHFKTIESNLPAEHSPVAKGRCLDCHVPHTSSEDDILKKNKGDLCADCHQEYVNRFEKSKHINTGGCLACHEAHYSENPPILRSESVDLCIKCHNESAGMMNHPVGKEYSSPIGNYVKCSGCHDPHGTPYYYFLKQKDEKLCVDCHSKIKLM